MMARSRIEKLQRHGRQALSGGADELEVANQVLLASFAGVLDEDVAQIENGVGGRE
jgi:hypothetical protein